MQSSAPMGRRIAAFRRRRGLSQAALAGLVGRSESWLSQVERGVRSVDRLSVLLDMARVLHVDVEALSGKPYQPAPKDQSTADRLTALRRSFTSYDRLLGGQGALDVDAYVLRASLRSAHGAYQAAQYRAVIDRLPDLLVAAEHHRVTSNDVLPYISAYLLAAKVTTKLGVTDLAMLSADRAANAASISDSSLAKGLSAYQTACALLRAGQAEDAERVAVSMAEQLMRENPGPDKRELSAVGALWLLSAVVAARRANRDTAWDRLNRADILAATMGEDGNYAWTAFGPTNVAVHRISVAAELGDAGGALSAAEAVDESRLPGTLIGRRAQVHLDVARALSQRRQNSDATLHLLEAERIAPESIAHNVIAQETIREMLSRGTRGKTRTLGELAKRADLID